jgi:hypothetical protein
LAGAGLVHVRVCVPPPHAALHVVQSLQPPSTGAGQACVLQVWLVDPSHAAPPLAGAGLVHVRVCVPPPQATLHADQSLQPPFTAQAAVLQV